MYGENIATGSLDRVSSVQTRIRCGIGDGHAVRPGNQPVRDRRRDDNRVAGGDDAGQASALKTPLRQPHCVREQSIVIAVLPPMLEAPYARAVQSLLARGLVQIVEWLVLQELKPRLPAHDPWLVHERTQYRLPRRVRTIHAGLLLNCSCGKCSGVSWIPWNEMCADTLDAFVGGESARHHRERGRRRIEGIPVRLVTGAIGVYDAAHVVKLYEEILVSLCCSGKRYPGRICRAAESAVH